MILAILLIVNGFMIYFFIPAALAFFSSIRSLKPVQSTIGISGRISMISLERVSPVIWGMVMSVITISKKSGCARNVFKASSALVVVITW